ncbi:MAG: peptide deformylase [Coprobacillus sp.]|nr:peptide deformylase [Coprobacillus sp.]
MKYKIIKDPNPKLRMKSEPLTLPLDKEDCETLDFMLSYIIKSQDEKYATKHNVRAGVGLAAPQLGILKRMFVIYIPKDEKQEEVCYQLVNPQIIEESYKLIAMKEGEGCLSVDEEHPGLAHRHYAIKMKAYDYHTKQDITIDASGYEAVVLQHEFDHLEGVLFYDRIDKLNPNKRKDNEELI